MKIGYHIFVILICLFQRLNAQSECNKIVKIKRTCTENVKLMEEVHYDKFGQKIKHIRFNVTMRHHFLYNVDSVVRIFEYDSLRNRICEYDYSFIDSIREKKELQIQYFYNHLGQLILKKHAHKRFSDEYFTYDELGNLIKDSSDVVYILKYEYSADSLILKASKYKNNFDVLVYHVIYEYDNVQRLIKDSYYNYENRLSEVTTYQYDENNNLVFQKTLHFDVHTVKRQRKVKESSFAYEYNIEGELVKEIGIGQWREPKVKIYKYEYY